MVAFPSLYPCLFLFFALQFGLYAACESPSHLLSIVVCHYWGHAASAARSPHQPEEVDTCQIESPGFSLLYVLLLSQLHFESSKG